MENGGKREGAGRPKGSTTKPQFRDFVSEKEVKELVEQAKGLAKAGKVDLLKFVLEHIFGKAPQNLDVTSNGEVLPLLGGLSNGSNNTSDKETTETEEKT